MNLRQARKKIKTIGNVSKITRAMQMVAAVKMRKAQQEAYEGLEYRKTLDMIAKKVIKGSYFDLKNKSVKKIDDKNLYVIISSNKGLCGSLNVNLFRFFNSHTHFETDDFIVAGKKAAEFLSHMGASVIADFSDQHPMDAFSAIFLLISAHFSKNSYKSIFIEYNHFISTFKNQPVKIQLFPIQKINDLNIQQNGQKKEREEYIIEPSRSMMIESLILDVVKEKIKTAFLESAVCENASRMMAMKNATDNAEDIKYDLTRLRNTLRQQGITYELLDMIAAST